MAFFVANEIEIDVAHQSGEKESLLIGERKRMFSGRYVQTVRAWANRFSAQTPPMPRADADALYRLLRGDGHNFRFAAAGDYYSGKGLPGTAASDPVAGGANGHLGADNKRITLDSDDTVSWTPTGADALTGDYTLLVWHLTSAGPDVWAHWAVRSLGGTVTYWVAGANQGDASTVTWELKLSVTSGVLKLGDGANADVFSDLVAVPFGMPTSWIEDLAAANTRQFPNRPYLEVSGSMVNKTVASPFTCCGVVESFTPVPYAGNLDGGRVVFSLEEFSP